MTCFALQWQGMENQGFAKARNGKSRRRIGNERLSMATERRGDAKLRNEHKSPPAEMRAGVVKYGLLLVGFKVFHQNAHDKPLQTLIAGSRLDQFCMNVRRNQKRKFLSRISFSFHFSHLPFLILTEDQRNVNGKFPLDVETE